MGEIPSGWARHPGWFYLENPDGRKEEEMAGIHFAHFWQTVRMDCGHFEIYHCVFPVGNLSARLKAETAMERASFGKGQCTVCKPTS